MSVMSSYHSHRLLKIA